ncbi:unnamed protein product [Ilex paraguariensis]|uniref:Uncharacterized protein n=1 Tax=Ilex paraguariensis TaxID=185542 RepID=A0ABC8UE65_9AQUA
MERTLLTRIAGLFQELASSVNSMEPRLEIGRIVLDCRLVATLIGYFGLVIRFAADEFSNKGDLLVSVKKKNWNITRDPWADFKVMQI